jgi:hypothetical protein
LARRRNQVTPRGTDLKTVRDLLEFRRVPVPKLCQNPIYLKCLELLFEREQVPQVVDIRHFRMELMESLEPEHIFRNQQVAGSIPAGGSSSFNHFHFQFAFFLTAGVATPGVLRKTSSAFTASRFMLIKACWRLFN